MTRRIICGLACALTVSSLLMPSVSLAAEWVKVGGNKYNTAASDEAGTWSWDGADDLKLNNYNGGEIQAAGKLNVNYSGTNIVTAEWIESINVSHGTNENAELNIQGDEGGTLSVTSTEDAILSTGNINIDGAGSVNATSAGFDAINAGGDLAIKGSGNVNATGASDSIRANGNITIDDSGAVTARATKDKVLEPTRTSPSRVAGRSRQAQPMVRPFGAATISTSRTAARSRQAPRKTLPSRPRAASQPQTPPST